MAVFLLPLIQIYTSGINYAEYTNPTLLLLFVIMNLLSNVKMPVSGVVEYEGGFKNTRAYAIWEMAINLGVSILAIYFFGICGALLGTIAALCYRGIVTIRYSNKKVLMRGQFQTYKIILTNTLVFAAVMAIFFVDNFSNMSFLPLLLNGVIHSIWIVGLYLLVNFLSNKSAFKTIFELRRRNKAQ